MNLIGSLMKWVFGFRQTYTFTRETPPDRLLELRNVCYTLLDDLDSAAGKGLQMRVDTAVSANEFWHMRPRMFDAVSEAHGESEAARRLMHLDSLLHVHHDRRSPLAGCGVKPAGAMGTMPSRRRRRATDSLPRFEDTR